MGTASIDTLYYCDCFDVWGDVEFNIKSLAYRDICRKTQEVSFKGRESK